MSTTFPEESGFPDTWSFLEILYQSCFWDCWKSRHIRTTSDWANFIVRARPRNNPKLQPSKLQCSEVHIIISSASQNPLVNNSGTGADKGLVSVLRPEQTVCIWYLKNGDTNHVLSTAVAYSYTEKGNLFFFPQFRADIVRFWGGGGGWCQFPFLHAP